MKKLFYLLALATSTAFGQFQFQSLLEHPTSSIKLFSDRNGSLATVNNNGLIMYSKDGGMSWKTSETFFHQSTNNATLRGFGKTIVAPVSVGTDFEVYISKDAGETWNLMLSSEVPYHFFYDISFIMEQEFFICGMKGIGVPSLIKTTDGGTTWTTIKTPVGASGIRTISFVNANEGYVKDLNNKFFKTTDGGENWTNATFPTNTATFAFSSFLKGVASNNQSLFETSDGGVTWNNRITGNLNYEIIKGDTIIAYSSISKRFYYTTNRFVSKTEKLFSGALLAQNPIAVLNDSSFVGFIGGMLKTTDKGVTWSYTNQSYQLPVNYAIKSFSWLNDSVGFFIATDGTYKTKNNGRNWTKVSASTITSNLLEKKVSFSTETNGVSFSENYNELFLTSNGGETWRKFTHTFNGDVRNVKMLSPSTGWLVGGFGSALLAQTADSGKTWTNVSSKLPTQIIGREIIGIEFLDNMNGFLLSDTKGGAMTTDGGDTWTFINLTSGGNAFTKIRYLTKDVLLAFQPGFYYRSDDGGVNWTMKNYPISQIQSEYVLDFADAKHGVLLTDKLLYTNNGGDTWEVYNAPVSNGNSVGLNYSVNGSGFFHNQQYILFNNLGDILTSDKEIVFAETTTQNELNQNSPNPFSTNTKISFTISEPSAKVSLDIVDMNGQVVETIFKNNLMSKGYHEVDYVNNNLKDGMYFIRLNTGNFTDVKKMLLAK